MSTKEELESLTESCKEVIENCLKDYSDDKISADILKFRVTQMIEGCKLEIEAVKILMLEEQLNNFNNTLCYIEEALIKLSNK